MAENQALQRLIQELEYLIQLSSDFVYLSKKRICVAKDVMSVPSSQLSRTNEPRQSTDTLHNLKDGGTQISFQDEDSLLEDEIKRILKGPTQFMTVGHNSRQSAPRIKKDFIKINKQNLGLEKKDTSRGSYNDNKGASELATRLLQSSKVNDSLLCEELALRSQLPKHRDILMVLREVYHFLAGSNRKAGKKEVMLKENFLERCNTSASRCDLEPDMYGILNRLLPHCGWAYGRNEITTAKEISIIKDTITELGEKLHSIQFSFNHDLKNVCSDQPELSCLQKQSPVQEILNLESPFWLPLVMSSVFQGVEIPPFAYYNKSCEWISFQNAVLELHEYYIQLKVLQSIHPIITEFLGAVDSDDTTAENHDENWMQSLAQLLKAAAVMGDFTGRLTVPILAGIKSVTEPPINNC